MTGIPNDFSIRSQIASRVLPDDAALLSISGIEGWLYSLTDPYGRQFQFFLWHDGEKLAVSLVDPPLERDATAAMKLQADGRLGPIGPDVRMNVLTAFQTSIAWMAYQSIRERLGDMVAD